MIKLLLKSCLILALITSLSKADQITTGNLLPNAGQGASSAQSVDNSIDKIGNTFSNFTSNNATNFSSEVEVTGTGTLSYSGTLLDITTGNDTTNQNKLDNGITLQGNTIIQNCEWASSSYACGNRGSGRDSYSTKIQILDSNNSLLSETNQIRNNDAGYGSTAFKYTDTLIFNNVGSNKFNIISGLNLPFLNPSVKIISAIAFTGTLSIIKSCTLSIFFGVNKSKNIFISDSLFHHSTYSLIHLRHKFNSSILDE